MSLSRSLVFCYLFLLALVILPSHASADHHRYCMDSAKIGSIVPHSSTSENWKRLWEAQVLFSTLCIETGDDIPFETLSYAYMERAMGYQGLGMYEESLADYGEALRRVPDNLEAHIGIGQVFLRLGNPERALAHSRIVLRWLPGDSQALRLQQRAHCHLDAVEMVPGGAAKCSVIQDVKDIGPTVRIAEERLEIGRQTEIERQLRNEVERQKEIERQIREIEADGSSEE